MIVTLPFLPSAFSNQMKAKSLSPAPFFFVVITTYNRAQLLSRALQSLLAQTEKDWEAIIIDDGSTDNTGSVMAKIQHNHPKLTYFRQKSSGAVAAKNAGITHSSGQYITFLDSDDEYHPEHLRHRKKMLLENPQIDFLHGGAEIIGSPYVPDKNNLQLPVHLKECAIGGTFFIRRTLMAKLRNFHDIPLGSDADFLERCRLADANIMTTNIPSYIYHREHANSITRNIMTVQQHSYTG